MGNQMVDKSVDGEQSSALTGPNVSPDSLSFLHMRPPDRLGGINVYLVLTNMPY
jgi:hypothetical protein